MDRRPHSNRLAMTADTSGTTANHSWHLHFEDRGDYLYAAVDGPEDSSAITIAYWREVSAECHRRGTRRLLVCDGLRGEPASIGQFQRLVSALDSHELRTVRIAFHEPVSEHLRVVEHGELIFREAGFTLRVFGSEREAEVWLRYGQV
ncbi:MAG: hypothetical protein ACREPN_02535 [Rudaea sp.]